MLHRDDRATDADQSHMSTTELAPELLRGSIFRSNPFNHLVGIQVDSLSTEKLRMHIDA